MNARNVAFSVRYIEWIITKNVEEKKVQLIKFEDVVVFNSTNENALFMSLTLAMCVCFQ